MTDKIFVWEAKDQKDNFKRSVESVKDQANDLIETFQKYQKFKMIITRDEFEKVCYLPGEYFDKTILANIKMPKNSGLAVSIEKLCELYSIDRPGYLQSLGLADSEINDCPGCSPKKPRLKGQGSVLYFDTYLSFTEYLTFVQGRFELNPDPIEKKLEDWNYYATTPGQIEMFQTLETLKNSFNTLLDKGVTGPANLEQISKMFPWLKFFNNSMSLNPEVLRSLILKIQ